MSYDPAWQTRQSTVFASASVASLPGGSGGEGSAAMWHMPQPADSAVNLPFVDAVQLDSAVLPARAHSRLTIPHHVPSGSPLTLRTWEAAYQWTEWVTSPRASEWHMAQVCGPW